jgi:hypothetical protein
LDDFSSGIKQLLKELEKEANEIIDKFKYNIKSLIPKREN